MNKYNSYHPNLKILATNNLLPVYFKTIIPRSTISTWKSKPNCTQHIIGMNSFVAEDDFMKIIETMSKKAFVYRSFRTMCKIIDIYTAIFNSIDKKKEVFNANLPKILTTIVSLKKMIGIKRACSVFGISINQFHHYKKSLFSCTNSPLKLCRNTYNHQLLNSEIEVIQHYFTTKKYLFWPATSVYHQILRDKAAFFSISTCYNYLKLLGIKRIKTKHRRKHHKVGLKASSPLEMLHMDISIFKTLNNAKVYLYVICDNFSRCILGYKVSTKFDVSLVLENIKEVKQNFTLLNNTQLIVDNGVENRTHILNDFVDSIQLNKIIAQLHITESNSMVESIFRQLKYYHIYPKNNETATDFINEIDSIINEQRNRPLHVLNGLTPIEVLNGKLPDKHFFRDDIIKSRLLRLEKNRLYGCGVC
jgi:hypothetical protein